MAALFHASIGLDPNGTPYWDLWSTPKAEALGFLHLISDARLTGISERGDRPDPFVAAALASAALGSRLLRMAGEIDAVRPLIRLDLTRGEQR